MEHRGQEHVHRGVGTEESVDIQSNSVGEKSPTPTSEAMTLQGSVQQPHSTLSQVDQFSAFLHPHAQTQLSHSNGVLKRCKSFSQT